MRTVRQLLLTGVAVEKVQFPSKPPEAFLGRAATEEAIKNVKGPRILHIATHGFFIANQSQDRGASPRVRPGFEDPRLRSGLFFAGASRVLRGGQPAPDLEDGVLTAYEASGLDLDGTELVVLSACKTGLGDVSNGDGILGLRRSFQEAGAGAVLMSMWSVPDREIQELMTLFYDKWLSGKDKHQALREAELDMRAKIRARYGEDRPFYWGGFVLVGP